MHLDVKQLNETLHGGSASSVSYVKYASYTSTSLGAQRSWWWVSIPMIKVHVLTLLFCLRPTFCCQPISAHPSSLGQSSSEFSFLSQRLWRVCFPFLSTLSPACCHLVAKVAHYYLAVCVFLYRWQGSAVSSMLPNDLDCIIVEYSSSKTK
jgi:hypothetical protein